MPSSTVKREKLVGPLSLVLIGCLFAVAFYVLKPDRQALSLNFTSPNSRDSGVAVDELDLAYLKASSASGRQTPDQLAKTIVKLAQLGQVDAALAVLSEHPDVPLTAQQRFFLDLELAAKKFVDSRSSESKSAAAIQLADLLQMLVDTPSYRDTTALKRAVTLSQSLGKTHLSAELYQLLGENDVLYAQKWYTECAMLLEAKRVHTQSALCYEQAAKSADNQASRFTLQLAQLQQLNLSQKHVEEQRLVDTLLFGGTLNKEQNERFAAQLLGIQKPELAHRVYALLAKQDPSNQLHWLKQAAMWAEAANEPGVAALYLDTAQTVAPDAERQALQDSVGRLLIGAGNNAQALAHIERSIANDPNNITSLLMGVSLARQVGDFKKALRWNKRVLALTPQDEKALQLQLDLSLANKALPEAKQVATQLVLLDPENKGYLRKLAQVLEWTGEPSAAMNAWRKLAEISTDKNDLAQLLRLAELSRDYPLAADVLYQSMLTTRPSDDDIDHFVKLGKLSGDTDTTIQRLHKLVAFYGATPFVLREIAVINQYHVHYTEALVAWQTYIDHYGKNPEAVLNIMELNWRLNRRDAAIEAARALNATMPISSATDFQIRLASEIAAIDNRPDLARLIEPLIVSIKDSDTRLETNNRLVRTLVETGADRAAIREATALWRSGKDVGMALVAFDLAIKVEDDEAAAPFLENSVDNEELRKQARYWELLASMKLRDGEVSEAVSAYQKALTFDNDNTSILAGLLWLYIDKNDIDKMLLFLDNHEDIAEDSAPLWAPFAIAYVQVGKPRKSLAWFAKLGDRIDSDYNMLLTYSDALEYAGHVDQARKVRVFTMQQLRPVLASQSSADQELLARQYIRMVSAYGSVDDNEKLSRFLLTDPAERSGRDKFWREDMAISWLMATQRHEHARIVMAKLHQERLDAPVWQELALAMSSDNHARIQAILNSNAAVSVGNHILALRQLGRDKEAYAMAVAALKTAPTMSDRDVAFDQYMAFRAERPQYGSGYVKSIGLNRLDILESGVVAQHSFASGQFGVGVAITDQQFSSERYQLAGLKERKDLTLTLFFNGRRQGGQIAAGVASTEKVDIAHATARYYLRPSNAAREYSAEVALNEAVVGSAEMRIAAMQNRVSLALDSDIGKREYIKLGLELHDIKTKIQEKRIARGLQSRVEMGIRGAFASNTWSTSVVAQHAQNELAEALPEELQLSEKSRLASMVSEQNTTLSIAASLARGGMGGHYPQTTSPRYFLNANIAKSWPSAAVGLQVDGGAGIRVLGSDELSLAFSHEASLSEQANLQSGGNSVGVNYRYHF